MKGSKVLKIVSLSLAIAGAVFGFAAVWRLEKCFECGVSLGFPAELRGFWWDNFGFISLGLIAAGFIVELINAIFLEGKGEYHDGKNTKTDKIDFVPPVAGNDTNPKPD